MTDHDSDYSGAWSLRLMVALLIAIGGVYLLPAATVKIEAGHSGVLWSRFFGGTRVDKVYGEGVTLKQPWDEIHVYETRLQERHESLAALTKDGLTLQVEVATRFALDPAGLGALHKFIGPQYLERLVLPEIRSHVRTHLSQFRSEEIYSSRRVAIQGELLREINEGVRVRYGEGERRVSAVFVEDVLIEGIRLPAAIEAAVESKLAMEQVVQEYDYRLAREQKEKERKRIEADGIHDFQARVNDGLSDRFLRWRAIEATEAVARSNNAKVVVMSGAEPRPPIVLGEPPPTH